MEDVMRHVKVTKSASTWERSVWNRVSVPGECEGEVRREVIVSGDILGGPMVIGLIHEDCSLLRRRKEKKKSS